MKKPELLAPAGDLNRCRTAIRYGADAVYIGGQNYSLRSRASNFSMEDIRQACIFAKDHGARIHVTVNMIPHNDDYEGLKEYLCALQDMGVTAVICASVSIMQLVKEAAPRLEVHCSTQMSVTNAYAAQFLYDRLHIDRVVLARECTMTEIEKLIMECPVETEAFIHGGMCANYSGRCTLSNRMTLRDANRGGCAQSCRWQYHLCDADGPVNEAMFTMGSKDLLAAEWIPNMMKAGVSSLKIEGRMKSEYYVASIVSAYRHLIDELSASNACISEERMRYHMQKIMCGENREVCPGFYDGIPNENSIIYHPNSDADVNHDFLATVLSYENGVAVIQTRNPIDRGQKTEALCPNHGDRVFTIESMQNESGEYLEAVRVPMTILHIPVPFAVEPNDIIRRSRTICE